MSLLGQANPGQYLTGKINKVTFQIITAYGIAVKNGFEGTEEEWLASLKGDPPTHEQITNAVIDYMNNIHFVRIGTVGLSADKWVGSDPLYSQVVSIDGVTENSQVDLTPSVEQLAVFYEKDLTFVTENDGGVVTVYAIGQKPTNDYVVQVTITEVRV